jgi:hypothetical protein
MSNRHGGDKKHHNGGDVSPPSVPAVQRRRNSSQKIDDAIAIASIIQITNSSMAQQLMNLDFQ